MARKKPDEKLEHDELKDGLKHNPFASLRPRANAPEPLHSNAAPIADPIVERATRSRAPEPKADPAPLARKSPAQPSVAAHERIVVRRERKGHGGKAVTIAEGPGLCAQDLSALAREAARALGAGARVEEGALVVQGEQTERLIAWLNSRGLGSVVRGN